MNCGNTNVDEDMIVAVVIIFHPRLHIMAKHQDRPVFTVFLTMKTSPKNIFLKSDGQEISTIEWQELKNRFPSFFVPK